MISSEDLEMLSSSFAGVMTQFADPAAADAALYDLGWTDLLEAAPLQGAAAAFTQLGTTNSASCLLDDVLAAALGLAPGPDVCVVLPAPNRFGVPATGLSEFITVDGLISSRVQRASMAVLVVNDPDGHSFRGIDPAVLAGSSGHALDAAEPYRRVRCNVLGGTPLDVTGTWEQAVMAAHVALAHQLIALSRVMLMQARQHAVDRVQFGRAVGSFQAVRHKLAEALVAIEGAAAVADACIDDDCEPLTAMLAKSLAGKAARLTMANSQQVLAGIGFTTDHPFHLSMKRAMIVDSLFGSARTLPTEIGRTLLALGAAPRLVEL